MSPTGLLLTYCLLIAVASIVGGWIPLVLRLTHARLQIALSLVSGVILGIAILEMLPHAIHLMLEADAASPADAPSTWGDGLDIAALWLVGGFLAMFLIERFFCFHHHEAAEAEAVDPARSPTQHSPHEHDHDHELTWAGALVGLTLHSLVAGMALAASVLGDGLEGGTRLAGIGTFLVIVLHKPFDSMTLGTVLAVRGHSRRRRRLLNGMFALAVPIGAALFALGLAGDAAAHSSLVGAALAFCAGAFLCIALSDLLPELQFHHHDRIKLSVALLAGLAIAWGVSRLEAAGHDDAEAAAGQDASMLLAARTGGDP